MNVFWPRRETSLNKHSEFFTGQIRTLSRLNDSPEDRAIESAHHKEKQLPTNVVDTLGYILPYTNKAMNLKLRKHRTDQEARASIVLDGKTVMADVPVDFLLELEKVLPEWRALFSSMPTLDAARKWVSERKGVYKLEEPVHTSQTEKQVYPVVLAPATDKHPAQVKEATRDVVVGTFSDMIISGAATTDQKADVLALCDKLIVAVKEARMRANCVDVMIPADGFENVSGLFASVFGI